MLDHISGIPDGHIVNFPNSARTFMKVCTKEGQGGVVDIVTGELIMVSNLPQYGLDVWCSEQYGEKVTIQHECSVQELLEKGFHIINDEIVFPPEFDEMITNGIKG